MLMQIFLQWLVKSTREMVAADIDNELELANDRKFRVERKERDVGLPETVTLVLVPWRRDGAGA